MHWIAPPEKDTTTTTATLEKRLWDAADQLRANSGLKAQEYSGPILGLIFLRFAEVRFAKQREKLEAAGASSRRGSRVDEPAAYHADGVLYLSPEARFESELLAEFKQRVAALERPEDMWPLAAWLREKQRAVDDEYDYRYAQLPYVFARLVREGRVTEDELSGLRDDKLAIIRRIPSL